MGKEREVVMVDVCRRPQHERGRHVLLGPIRPSSAVAQVRLVGLPRRHYRTYVLGAGGLNYDPLSYAQNFDDGSLGECEPDFTARFAPARQAAGTVGHLLSCL